MTGPVRDGRAMVAGMAPALRPGAYVFCTTRDAAQAARAQPSALATFAEDEGTSLVLPQEAAVRLGFDAALPMACITLTVHSALDGVGLTAAVAAALAAEDIPCNMVAAYHHDHVFVPQGRVQEALDALRRLQAGADAS